MEIREIRPECLGNDGMIRPFNFLVAVSQYNSLVTDRLVEGAMGVFRDSGPEVASVTLLRVPGALELPFVIRKGGETGRYDGALALGCVIRGETGHYDTVVSGVTQGLTGLNLDGKFPVVFGILTTDTLLQALDRVGGKAGHKGVEGANTLLSMVRLSRALSGERTGAAPSEKPGRTIRAQAATIPGSPMKGRR